MSRRYLHWLALCGAVLAGCTTGYGLRPHEYVVVRGDTLYSIAWRYGVDMRELVRINNLADPNRILVGQRLLLGDDAVDTNDVAPATDTGSPPRNAVASTTPHNDTPRSRPRRVEPPAAERVATADGTSPAPSRDTAPTPSGRGWVWPVRGRVIRGFQPDQPGRKGIQIAAALGTTVTASRGGEIVYSGSGLPGYGRLIIVKHSESLLSAYGFLGKILSNEGDRVSAGQPIGEVGNSPENRPALHFEIRQNGKPVDPLRFLQG